MININFFVSEKTINQTFNGSHDIVKGSWHTSSRKSEIDKKVHQWSFSLLK